jgi:sporulation protein YlmC with PRC-barrel domain
MAQKVLFKRKTTEEIEKLEVEDGSLIYNTDNGKTYMDYGSTRIPTGGGANGGIYVGNDEPTDSDVTLWIDENTINTKASTEKNIITARLSSTTTIGNINIIPFDTVSSVGDKLTYNSTSNSIIIGSGITKVLVNANLQLQGSSPKDGYSAYLYKNGAAVSYARAFIYKTDATNIPNGCVISPILLDVKEGDSLSLYKYGSSGDVRIETYLTVEAVE